MLILSNVNNFRGKVFGELKQLYEKTACREFLKNLPLLEKYCGYR